MVFAIAIVPKGDDIPKPDSAATLADLGVIGSGTATTVPTDSTTPTSDSTGTTSAVTTTTG
jgi:hypothetical protein